MESNPILTNTGYADNDIEPFNLPVPSHGFRRFRYRRDLAQQVPTPDYCYPFHTACWSLLRESDGNAVLDNDFASLFNVFESLHYNRQSHCLQWDHGYYLADMLDEDKRQCSKADIIAIHKDNEVLLADPLLKLNSQPESYPPGVQELKTQYSNERLRFQLLSAEILDSILCILDFQDAWNVILATDDGSVTLSSSFWRSRFFGSGEAAFARSMCDSSCCLEKWFFRLKSEMENGVHKTNLQNRQRIWKLGVELCTIVRTINEPGRALHGNIIGSLPVQTQGAVSSLAQTYGIEGCEELKRIHVHFGNRTVRTILPTYITVSNRRLVSGLTFIFIDDSSIDAGYVVSGRSYQDNTLPPEFLWLAISPFGLEAISLDAYPRHFVCESPFGCRSDIGVTRWPLKGLRDIFLGLDVRLPLAYSKRCI